MNIKKNHRLTEQKFWEEYWKNLRLPVKVDTNLSFDRCLSKVLLKRLEELPLPPPFKERYSIVEIGAAPGKWLALFPQDKYTVSGIEYSEAGMDALTRNMMLLGISPLNLIHGDFFEIEPKPTYDVVMSLGFIEHFDDPIRVLRRHIEWLSPGGYLVIGVPNFTGIHGFAQRLLDVDILKAHNTKIMNQSFFEGLPEILGIKLCSFEYLGSLEPSLPMTFRPATLSNVIQRAALRLASLLRRWRWLDCINSSYISSYILAIYRKPE